MSINKELRVLILEDVPADAELTERELRRGGIIFLSKRVETREAFLNGLKDFAPDLILADYSLPHFDGISALAIAKEQCPDVPFILVSGAIGEDLAIDIFKQGATDYVLKHRLSRLLPSVRRAFSEIEEKVQRKRAEELLRESEEKYRAIFENTGTAMVIDEEDTTIFMVNAEFKNLSGYSREEVEGKKSWTEFIVKDDLDRLKEYHYLRRIASNKTPKNYEFRFIDRRGNVKDIFTTVTMIPGTRKSVASLLDITDRKKKEEQINHLLDVVKKGKEEWEMTFDSVTELIMLVDQNLRITRCNKSFAKFSGIPIREIAGRKCYEFFSCTHKQIGLCKLFMQTGEALPKTEIKIKEGHWFYVSHCPVTDEKGIFHFSVVVATDITDIKNTQQKLMEYQEELKKRIKELEDFYEMGVGRELRMIELKKEIESLEEELVKYKKDGNS